MAIHLAVACDVFNSVLFGAVFFPLDVLGEIWDWIESVPEDFSYLLVWSGKWQNKQLIPTLFNKHKYVFHIRNIKLYLENESSWLVPYSNTKRMSEAKMTLKKIFVRVP